MVNETALEIYTNSASIVGATLQESLLVALKDSNVSVHSGVQVKIKIMDF